MMVYLLRPLVRANLRRCLSLSGHRCLSISSHNMQQACGKAGKLPANLKRAQKLFQEKNDLPVHLKGGSNDKILYLSTVSLAGVGLLYSLVFMLGYLFD